MSAEHASLPSDAVDRAPKPGQGRVDDGRAAGTVVARAQETAWLRAAKRARLLAWVSLGWMTVEGALGLASGVAAGSIALVGWALSSVLEGVSSIIVIWRFTGSRTQSEAAEERARKAVAVSFWLLAPYVTVESVRNLIAGTHLETTLLGIAVTISSLLVMPALGIAKRRLGARLDSDATAGEGTQNLLCAYLAGAVLVGLAANAAFGWWWLDPIAGLLVAAVAVWEGREAWRGDPCC